LVKIKSSGEKKETAMRRVSLMIIFLPINAFDFTPINSSPSRARSEVQKCFPTERWPSPLIAEGNVTLSACG
jgi:hypothetical protein